MTTLVLSWAAIWFCVVVVCCKICFLHLILIFCFFGAGFMTHIASVVVKERLGSTDACLLFILFSLTLMITKCLC